jgi:hypothetical protein
VSGEGNQTVILDQAAAHAKARDLRLILLRELPEDHPIYKEIGRIAARWAHVEHILDQIFWKLSGAPDEITGSCITSRINGYRPRFEIIAALIKRRGLSGSEESALLACLNCSHAQINNLADKRNRYIHGAWYLRDSDRKTGRLGQFNSFHKSENQFGFQPAELAQIRSTSQEIKAASNALWELKDRIFAAIAPSRNIP